MKSRLHNIDITNFKAFKKLKLELAGRHLLVYGANGSGKSSLYWALYTFLQSARKSPQGVVAKYFDTANPQNLLNIHENAAENPGEIALTFRDISTKIDTTYRISQSDHGTFRQSSILKGELASDFITYRFFFGFSAFRNSQKFNIWPLFEKEILPYCVAIGGKVPLDCWNAIKSGNPNPGYSRGLGGAYAYADFNKNTREFATMLGDIVRQISDKAQDFYDRHFAADDPAPVTLRLGLTKPPDATGTSLVDFEFTKPVVEFGIQVDGNNISRPQTYLNEAKLTQFALSIRFAASLVNLHESDLKLLVLDDLLVSLDMSNRMKVVDILLSEQFADYQKIILTHDLGFFREFRRIIGDQYDQWCFQTFQGNPKDGIEGINEKSAIEKAHDYLHGYDLEAAAHQLRKAAEETAKQYRRVAMGESPAPGKFHSLTEDLRAAINHLQQQLPITLYKQVLNGIPEEHRDKLICASDDDIDSDTTLDAPTKGKIKTQRNRLRQFFAQDAWKLIEAIETVDAVIRMKDRVLNPAAHWNEEPLYNEEVRKALKLIERLKTVLLS